MARIPKPPKAPTTRSLAPLVLAPAAPSDVAGLPPAEAPRPGRGGRRLGAGRPRGRRRVARIAEAPILVRFYPEDFARVSDAAATAGMPLARFVRTSVLARISNENLAVFSVRDRTALAAAISLLLPLRAAMFDVRDLYFRPDRYSVGADDAEFADKIAQILVEIDAQIAVIQRILAPISARVAAKFAP
jgi:hypothetical protein